jgi:hypothetical protein
VALRLRAAVLGLTAEQIADQTADQLLGRWHAHPPGDRFVTCGARCAGLARGRTTEGDGPALFLHETAGEAGLTPCPPRSRSIDAAC